MLQRQEWQRNAAAAADQARALRAAGLTRDDKPLVAGFHRVCAGVGGMLIRLGARLQSTGATAVHPAR
jgi:hypothetical protein